MGTTATTRVGVDVERLVVRFAGHYEFERDIGRDFHFLRKRVHEAIAFSTGDIKVLLDHLFYDPHNPLEPSPFLAHTAAARMDAFLKGHQLREPSWLLDIANDVRGFAQRVSLSEPSFGTFLHSLSVMHTALAIVEPSQGPFVRRVHYGSPWYLELHYIIPASMMTVASLVYTIKKACGMMPEIRLHLKKLKVQDRLEDAKLATIDAYIEAIQRGATRAEGPDKAIVQAARANVQRIGTQNIFPLIADEVVITDEEDDEPLAIG